MKPHDKISKSSWTLLEGAKDSVLTNVTNAVRSGQLKIESKQMTALLTVISTSIEEGYHKGHRTFMRNVDAELEEFLKFETAKRAEDESKKK